MDKWAYIMFIEKTDAFDKVTKEAIARHVAHIKTLDDNGQLILAGPFKGYPGVVGMVVFKAQSPEDAEAFCKADPLVLEGYAPYTLRTLRAANRENNYLL